MMRRWAQQTQYTLRRNTASITKDLIWIISRLFGYQKNTKKHEHKQWTTTWDSTCLTSQVFCKTTSVQDRCFEKYQFGGKAVKNCSICFSYIAKKKKMCYWIENAYDFNFGPLKRKPNLKADRKSIFMDWLLLTELYFRKHGRFITQIQTRHL